ncbi:ComEA family DNA-binding protein [Halomonas sp. WWR20]
MKKQFSALLLACLLGTTALASAEETVQSVNLNQADIETLAHLPGIGEVKAQAIVKDREENGPYQSAEDLARVDGIGPATVKQIEDYVSF